MVKRVIYESMVEGFDEMKDNPVKFVEEMIASSNGGVKQDGGKLRYDLIEAEFLKGMATILTHGAAKYGDRNWQGLEMFRVERALMTHFNNYRLGEKIDKDEPHQHNLFAVAVNAMFMWWLDVYGNEVKGESRKLPNNED